MPQQRHPSASPIAGRRARPANVPPPKPRPQRPPAHLQTPDQVENRVTPNGRRQQDKTIAGSILAYIDKSSTWTLFLASIAFLVFFVVLASVITYSSREREIQITQAQIETDLEYRATAITDSLDNRIAQISNTLSLNASPKQIIDMTARSNYIASVALIDGQGNIIEGTKNAEALKQVSLAKFPQSGIIITSLIGANGQVNPVIVQRAGTSFLVLAMTPGALIDAQQGSFAIVEANGRVIDGPPEMGRLGAAEYYNMDANRLMTLMRSGSPTLFDHDIGTSHVWLAMQPIQNSSLVLVTTRAKQSPMGWVPTMVLLTLLFLGTCVIVYILMRNMLKQIQRVEDTNVNTEISQQRYRAAIDSSRGGVWEINLGENEAYVSRSLSSLLGMRDTEQVMPVEQFLNVFQPSDRERLLHLARRAHMSGDFEIDLTVARLPIILSCRGHPLTRGSDHARVIIGMALDVTEQRSSQIRLKAAEARLFDALRSMNDSFVIWDQRNQLVLWNARFENFFGFPPGTLSKGLDHVTVKYNSQKAIDEIIDSGDGQSYEIRLRDGRWIRYLETDTADGGRVSIGTDVTAIRTREQQLQENEQALQKTIDVLRKSQSRIVELAESYEQEKIRAEEANQSKSEFLANMSHELRTPLNAINGFSDIMQKEMFGPLGDPRYKEYVNDILFSGQHLLSLINDILDMSKIEAGKMNLNTESMQMNEMVEQVIRIVRGRAEDNRIKLVYEPSELQEVEADPRAVKQVLLNLMTNAIKFTPEGGVVSIDVVGKKAGVIISVSDTGIGIAQEDIDRLAKPFEQIESKHSRQHEGTGLGLALSKSLVEMHGGNFKIESMLGEGTTVTFTLPNKPLKKVEVTPETEVAEEISRLAKDIADILSDSQEEENQTKTVTSPPPPAPATQEAMESPIQAQTGQSQSDATSPQSAESLAPNTVPPSPYSMEPTAQQTSAETAVSPPMPAQSQLPENPYSIDPHAA